MPLLRVPRSKRPDLQLTTMLEKMTMADEIKIPIGIVLTIVARTETENETVIVTATTTDVIETDMI